MTTQLPERPEYEPFTGASLTAVELPVDTARRPRKRFLAGLGPGVVSGAADVDPTTVATLAVIGAGTIYGLAWLTLLLFPIIAVVQVISTHVGAVGRKDLQTAVAQSYGSLPRWLLLISIVAVTIVTIGADLEGGAAGIGLLTHLDWRWFVLPLSLGLLAVLMLGNFDQVQRALKYVLLCLLAYAVAAVLAHPNWGAVARGSLVPHFEWTGAYTAGALSLLGTTVTSYVYVWQTIAHAERGPSLSRLRAGKRDAVLGSFFAVAVFWFILIAMGATLGVHHLQANTASDAAQALRPLAGKLAGGLFAVGLLASALVALPVLIATTAYVTGAQLQRKRGLSVKVREAPLFYGTLVGAAVLGTGVALSGISPIRLLFIAGIIGGIATPIGLGLLLVVAGNHTLMRGRPVSGPLLITGWVITISIAGLSLAFIAQQLTRSS
jgi:Mn2+/Fe2+ NRAMP family transporter